MKKWRERRNSIEEKNDTIGEKNVKRAGRWNKR
jgi:hypothetical protein